MNPACVNTWGSRRWRTLVVTCATTLVITVAAVAAPPVPKPPAPQLPLAATLKYPEGTNEGHEGNRVWFGWSHTVPWSPFPNPSPNPLPRYFLVCLYKSGVSNCLSTYSKWWVDEATHRGSEIWRGIPRQIVGYNYSFQPWDPFTSDQLDRQMQWSIGACTTMQVQSCEFAPKPMAVWFSSKNLGADISNLSLPDYLDFRGEVENWGSTDSGTFTSELVAIQAVVDADNPNLACETDVNAPGLTDADFALTEDGVSLLLGELPKINNGTMRSIGSVRVVAIHRAGAQTFAKTNEFSGIPPGREFPAVSVEQVDMSMTDVWATTVWGTIHRVDTTNAIVEFDETDNLAVECQLIY
jgi:hypothetical protein